MLRRTIASAILASIACTVSAAAAQADTIDVDGFEAYSTGEPTGQFGWTAQDMGGYNASHFDMAFVDPSSGPWGATFGTRALRFSNAVTSGGFGNQLQTPSLADEAGETSALNIGLSGGTRQTRMEASFDIASATRAYQPGMSFSISMDRGDGARQTWLRVFDEPTGMTVQVQSIDATIDDFVVYTVATGLSYTEAHSIDMIVDFVDGPRNDVMTVLVGGECGSWAASGTWEDYHRTFAGTVTVDSLLFRLGGSAVPANLGNGYLMDNVKLRSSTVPAMPALGAPTAPGTPSGHMAIDGQTTVSAPVVNTNVCAPVSGYTATATPLNGGTPLTFTSPTPNFTFPTPFGGAFTLTVSATNAQGTGPQSPRATFTIDPVFAGDDELAQTGADTGPLGALAAALVLAGVAMVTAGSRLRPSRT